MPFASRMTSSSSQRRSSEPALSTSPPYRQGKRGSEQWSGCVTLRPFPSIPLPHASEQCSHSVVPAFPPAGPRYDTRTIVWICLTLITGLVVLLLLLICKKRWAVLGLGHARPRPHAPLRPRPGHAPRPGHTPTPRSAPPRPPHAPATPPAPLLERGVSGLSLALRLGLGSLTPTRVLLRFFWKGTLLSCLPCPGLPPHFPFISLDCPPSLPAPPLQTTSKGWRIPELVLDAPLFPVHPSPSFLSDLLRAHGFEFYFHADIPKFMSVAHTDLSPEG